MSDTKVIDLECLRAFKEKLDVVSSEKFAGKQQFEELATTLEENYKVAEVGQVDSMLDDIFG